MGKQQSDLVRFSRDGDQFHYLWAARRCLKLLNPASGIVCITIEGIAQDEAVSTDNGGADEIVDVAEYYGSSKLEEADAVIYYQLKHSTQRLDKPWVLSELKKTLSGFLERYLAAKESNISQESLRFTFLTNRPFSSELKQLFEELRSAAVPAKHKKQWDQIVTYLTPVCACKSDMLAFFKCFRIEDASEGVWQQSNLLSEDFRKYLPGVDSSGPSQLWRLVSEKATSLHSTSPEITKYDVLRALNTSDEDMYPAPSLIVDCDKGFSREQEDEIYQQVLAATRPVIIHADGGVGKSNLAFRLVRRANSSSSAVLFDCFGNGTYRDTINLRHGHETALTQIANELAAMGLCHPIIPDRTSKPASYLRAFSYRLEQASAIIAARDTGEKLLVFIDAADNAQMAAEENNQQDCFARDLIRLAVPDNVRLVFLCRTHRVYRLKPPSGYIDIPLRPFTLAETEKLLLSHFPNATDHDVEEFHRLSSQNPRVQATALSSSQDLNAILSILGPEPTTVEAMIRNIFEASLQKLSDSLPEEEKHQLGVFCEALASLTPLIPIQVLSAVTNLPEPAIRSFVSDIGRPISLVGNAIQFTDEPSETWFRETYRPDEEGLQKLLSQISPLASRSSYVASTLPQLLLQVGKFDDLISSVLNDEYLPANNEVDRRHVSLKRAQFALRAALASDRLTDACQIAFKAASESAGDDRQHQLFRQNSDLIPEFLPSLQIRELVSNSTFSTAWHGGRYVYDAAMLSGCAETKSEGRGYLRVAHRWLDSWSRLSREERKRSEVVDEDIVQLALSHLNIHGEERCVNEIARWHPRHLRFRVAADLSKRLMDLGRFEQIEKLLIHANEQPCILLAIVNSLGSICRYPSTEATTQACYFLNKYRRAIKKAHSSYSYKNELITLVNHVAQAAIVQKIAPRDEIAELVAFFLPSIETAHFGRHQGEGNFALIRGLCLLAALKGEELELADLANSHIKEKIKDGSGSHLEEVRDFQAVVGEVFCWHVLWSKLLVGDLGGRNLDEEVKKCRKEMGSYGRSYYQQQRQSPTHISKIWLEILLLSDASDVQFQELETWRKSLEGDIYANTLTELARISARSSRFQEISYGFASDAFALIESERMDAQEKVDLCCELARAIFVADKNEASFYFGKAIEVAGKTGDENLERWDALLFLAEAGATNESQPKLAYELSRTAELTYEYVVRDKHFSWDRSIRAIAKLCPSSAPIILSRWWDRRFAVRDHLFPSLTEELVSSGNLSAVERAAFIGFRYRWEYSGLVRDALTEEKDSNRKRDIYKGMTQYLRLLDLSSNEGETVYKLGEEIGITSDKFQFGISRSELDELRNSTSNAASSGRTTSFKKEDEVNWEAIFDGLDFSNLQSLNTCHKRFKSQENRQELSAFCREYFHRTPIIQAGPATLALFSLPDIGVYSLKTLFECLPERWLKLRHYKTVLQEVVRHVCKTYYLDLRKSDYFQFLPWDFLHKHAGLTEPEIFGLVLKEFSYHSSFLTTSQLFGLVNMISTRLTPSESQAALEYGLDYLSDELDETDGDGPWNEKLLPPARPYEALAGYLWARLGSIEIKERWEAAHTICLLAEFGQCRILETMAQLAEGTLTFAFHAPILPFYDYSAQLWLLYALARICKMNPDRVQMFHRFLKSAASPVQRHVLIRGKGASILISLHENKIIELSSQELERLISINTSKRSICISKSYEREISTSVEDDRKYYFAYDFDRYWFERLGRIFALGAKDIEARAKKIVLDDWQVGDEGGWKVDPRHGLYREQETRHSHYDTPATEPLSFYRSFHALMTVAGDLIEKVQRCQDPEDAEDELSSWIDGKGLTRHDGLWVFDRRDPAPQATPDWKNSLQGDNWPYSVQKSYLVNVVLPSPEQICLWGRWTNAHREQVEKTSISSALVSPSHSSSLLRALQLTENPHNYCLPWDGSDHEISYGPYHLKSWISLPDRDLGVDKMDPWSGPISYPTLRPADWFCEQFGLEADEEKRNWYFSDDERENAVFSALAWQEQGVPEYYEAEHGRQLTGRLSEILRVLHDLEMDLIVEVQVTREISRQSYSADAEDAFDFYAPYTLLMLVKANGEIEKL